jgi:hypothetical protein
MQKGSTDVNIWLILVLFSASERPFLDAMVPDVEED